MAPRSQRKRAHGRVLTCYCDGSCPSHTNDTCETKPGGFCFSSVDEFYDDETGRMEEERTFGCISPDESGGLFQLNQCKVAQVPHLHGKNIHCCQTDFCNKDKLPVLPKKSFDNDNSMEQSDNVVNQPSVHYFALVTSIIISISAFLVVTAVIYLTFRRREKK